MLNLCLRLINTVQIVSESFGGAKKEVKDASKGFIHLVYKSGKVSRVAYIRKVVSQVQPVLGNATNACMSTINLCFFMLMVLKY